MYLRPLVTEGTISWLVGYHSVLHSLFVFIAWVKVYRKFPSPMELFCILIHDIGYCGRNYLSEKSHAEHECLGAEIAGRVFGEKAATLCAEHRKFGGTLEVPDEYSHVLMPTWLVWVQAFFERPWKYGMMMPGEWKEYNLARYRARRRGTVLSGQFRDVFKTKKEAYNDRLRRTDNTL